MWRRWKSGFRRVARWVGGGLLAAGVGDAAVRAAPRLLSPGRDATGAFSVTIADLAGPDYTLEASRDLQTWYVATNGIATSGLMRVTDPNGVPPRRVYYRARDGQPAFIRVEPQVDTNAMVVALLTPEAGGECRLTNSAGVEFHFTVAANQVSAPVAIQMSPITNYTSFPQHGGLNAAVAFGPEGYEFSGAGVLEIQFPAPVAMGDLTSYSLAGDGTRFHFLPDRLGSNQVSIPVAHFSGLGVAGWAADERAAVLGQAIQLEQDALAMELTRALRKIRDRGEENPGRGAAEVAAIAAVLEDYYDTTLEPYLERASKDCAVLRQLLPRLLGWERQRQLLGMGTGETPSWVNLFSDGFCNCVKEAFAKCDAGALDTRDTMASLLGLERQAQLLGAPGISACPSLGGPGILETLTKIKCSPAWSGFLNYSDTADRDYTTNYVDEAGNQNTQRQTTRYQLSFQALATESSIVESNPFDNSIRWRIQMRTQAAAAWHSTSYSQWSDGCLEVIDDNQTTGSGQGPLDVSLEFLIQQGQVSEFTFSYARDLTFPSWETTQSTTQQCPDHGGKGTSISHSSATTTYLSPAVPAFEDIAFSQQSFLALDGSGRREEPTGGWGGTHVISNINFSLRRKPE